MQYQAQKHLDLHPEVKEALNSGKPVVALESTIVAHGMPWPENIDTANSLQSIIREEGAVPATIAVLNGKFKVGLTDEELELLGKHGEVSKLSRRDLPGALLTKEPGATTVASTMIIAALAGIRIFATGGIGGVHRGAEQSWDISADLTELQRSSVAVVSAGAKAILDIPKTLEVLETYGVPVLGYQTDSFPAFYSRSSGLGVDMQINNPEEAARFLRLKWESGLDGGVLIANPVPEKDSLPRSEMETFINLAIGEAMSMGILGKQLTPFLLKRMTELTSGRSLVSNVALVRNNARVAARIAAAFMA